MNETPSDPEALNIISGHDIGDPVQSTFPVRLVTHDIGDPAERTKALLKKKF